MTTNVVVLGKGAFGVVRRQGDVAIKRPTDDLGGQVTSLNERTLLRDLNHPNIVKLMGDTMVDGCLELTLELFDLDLCRLIHQHKQAQRSMDYRLIHSVMRQCVLGVQYLHSQHIVHCDLKPGNILIQRLGHVVLADFGTAVRFKTLPIPKTHEVTSLWYRAPELLETLEFTPAIDIWALGCVYGDLLLAGQHRRQTLFPGKTPTDQLLKIIEVPVSFGGKLMQHMLDMEVDTRWSADQCLACSVLSKTDVVSFV